MRIAETGDVKRRMTLKVMKNRKLYMKIIKTGDLEGKVKLKVCVSDG